MAWTPVRVWLEVEAEQAVDLVLVQDALVGLQRRARVDHGRPVDGVAAGGGLRRGREIGHRQLISISSISTAFTLAGAITRLVRRRISMRSW